MENPKVQERTGSSYGNLPILSHRLPVPEITVDFFFKIPELSLCERLGPEHLDLLAHLCYSVPERSYPS